MSAEKIIIETFRKKDNKNHKGIFNIRHKTFNRVLKHVMSKLRRQEAPPPLWAIR